MSTYLVLAHQTASAPELLDALLTRKQEDRRAIFVLLAPATPVQDLVDVPEGDSQAVARQSLVAAQQLFEREGLEIARAIVGDPDPLKAVLNEFIRARRTYDGIILCTLPYGTSRWLSRDLPREVESLFQVPVTHVIAYNRAARTPKPGRVVTVTAGLGCRGDEIAALVADRLCFRYYDWEVTSEAASRAGVPPELVATSEQVQSLLERVLQRLLLQGVTDGSQPIGRLSSRAMSSAIAALSTRQYREFVERVILELAERGDAVILGHASQVLLADQPDVFRVLITGSQEKRAERVAVAENRSMDEARRMVRESDYERRSFFKQTYGFDLLGAGGYDLTLNSDALSPEAAASGVVAFFQMQGEAETTQATPRAASLPDDLVPSPLMADPRSLVNLFAQRRINGT